MAALMVWRGTLLAVPLLVVWVLVESPTPGVDLLRVGASFLLAIVGGAGGGLVYGLVRPLVKGSRVARWLGAVLTVAPYFLAVCAIIRVFPGSDHRGAPWGRVDMVIVGALSLLLGTFLMTSLFPERDS
jgi:hypothetical protein